MYIFEFIIKYWYLDFRKRIFIFRTRFLWVLTGLSPWPPRLTRGESPQKTRLLIIHRGKHFVFVLHYHYWTRNFPTTLSVRPCRLVGLRLAVIISWKSGKFHFHAPVGALVQPTHSQVNSLIQISKLFCPSIHPLSYNFRRVFRHSLPEKHFF